MPTTYMPDHEWAALLARLVELHQELPGGLDLRSAIAIELAERAGVVPEYMRADVEGTAA